MNVGNHIIKSNIDEVAEAIKQAALNNGQMDDSIVLRFQSQEDIKPDYYSFSIENVDFVDCYIYPARKSGYFKGLLDKVKIKVEGEK